MAIQIDLKETVDWETLLCWKFLWLRIQLERITTDVTDRSFTVDGAVSRYNDVISARERIFWEVVTIRGMDESEHDLERALRALPWYNQFKDEQRNTFTAICDAYDRKSNGDRGAFLATLRQ